MLNKFSMENKYKAFLLVSLKSLGSSWIVETLYQASLFSNNNLSYIFRQTHAIISSPKCVHRRNFLGKVSFWKCTSKRFVQKPSTHFFDYILKIQTQVIH